MRHRRAGVDGAICSRDWTIIPRARQLVAATVTAELCRKLYAGGERNLHFYTLNRAELSYAICHLLGMRPQG